MRALLAAVVLALLALPAGASADEPPFIDWSSWLPPSAGTYQPSAEDDCRSGCPSCVDKVIRSMTQRFDRLAETCDHNAMFSLTYLRTTEEYQRASLTPGFFSDPYFVNHEDAVFARYYFDAYDGYVLAGIGLVKPDGSSRKPDHDKVNQFLDDVTPTFPAGSTTWPPSRPSRPCAKPPGATPSGW